MRALPAFLAAALLLAGCPLPQPLPDYPKGTVAPPRIVVDDNIRPVTNPGTFVRVPVGCSPEPVYTLDAFLRDTNTTEPFPVRWFVNYAPTSQPAFTIQQEDTVRGATDGAADPTLRELPRAYAFRPYQFQPVPGTGGEVKGAAGALHVVELVVSNGFDPAADTSVDPLPALPYRTPAQGFEVQVYRWIFVLVPLSGTDLCPFPPP